MNIYIYIYIYTYMIVLGERQFRPRLATKQIKQKNTE